MDGALVALLTLGPLTAALLFVVVWLITHPETAQRWAEIFYSLASRLRRKWDRRAVQHGLQSRLDKFAGSLASETGRP